MFEVLYPSTVGEEQTYDTAIREDVLTFIDYHEARQTCLPYERDGFTVRLRKIRLGVLSRGEWNRFLEMFDLLTEEHNE